MADSPDLKLFHAAPETAKTIAAWLAYFRSERRASGHTLEAYGRDISQFMAFLADHLGGAPSLADLAGLTPSDFRAFLANRRSRGSGSRTLARQLSAIRSLFRHLEKNGLVKNAALAALKGPKLAHAVPRPLSITAARRLCVDVAVDAAREPARECEPEPGACVAVRAGRCAPDAGLEDPLAFVLGDAGAVVLDGVVDGRVGAVDLDVDAAR